MLTLHQRTSSQSTTPTLRDIPDFFYEGYEGILSKQYPTKGVKTYSNFLDKDRLTAVIAGGAKIRDEEVQKIIAPAAELLDKTDDVYEKDEIMNMIWGAVMEGLMNPGTDRSAKQGGG